MQRRTSETGRRNFRSKRFSRNMDAGQSGMAGGSLKRAQSLHMDRVRDDEDLNSWNNNEDMQQQQQQGGGSRSTAGGVTRKGRLVRYFLASFKFANS